MSHTFTDDDLLTWEAFASSGNFGLAIHPRIVFNCLTDPSRPARYVAAAGDEADAEGKVLDLSDDELRDLFRTSRELE